MQRTVAGKDKSGQLFSFPGGGIRGLVTSGYAVIDMDGARVLFADG